MNGARDLRSVVTIAGLLIVSALGVARLQPRLARTVHDAKQREDVYVLPPPEELKVTTLGWRAAAVDLLWSKLLVEYGVHWHEKRPFPDVPNYLDAILALEPDYAPLFKFADTLIVYRPPVGTEADVRLARKYLVRGLEARANDPEVWTQYGQFVAFIAPQFLKSDEEREQWRQDGARALMRGVELGGNVDRSISAATILSKSGALDAAIRYLERAWAATDDPAEREQIENKIRVLRGGAYDDSKQKAITFIEQTWRTSFPFLSRGEFLLIGPSRDPLHCAGRDADASDPGCARDWGPHLPSLGGALAP